MSASRPLLLDLFCGAGGCAVGYHRAGFDVVGIDHKPQPRYPFRFIQRDALQALADLVCGWNVEEFSLSSFAAIHASPPCQAFSVLKHLSSGKHPDLIQPTRELLQASRKLWVIENVVGAPLFNAVMLCGSAFRLDLRRHRLFESNIFMLSNGCDHGWQKPRFPANRSDRRKANKLARVVSGNGHDTRKFNSMSSVINVVGGGSRHPGGVAEWRRAMGIDWMTRDELSQAIPPAYTEFIGRQLISAMKNSS